MYHKLCRIMVAVMFICIIPVLAQAATLQITAGQLTGANGVSVNGLLYDVEFVDATCVAAYTGCDTTTDFVFDRTGALLASWALLEQVFLGVYDTNLALTAGIEDTSYSFVMNAYYGATDDGFGVERNFWAAANSPLAPEGFGGDYVVHGSWRNNYDATWARQNVYGVWTESVNVPAPAALLITIPGVIGFICTRRKRALQQSV